jgi:hypothetical protein
MTEMDRSHVASRTEYAEAPGLTPEMRWHFAPDDGVSQDLIFTTEDEAYAAQQGWRIARGYHPITGLWDGSVAMPTDPVKTELLEVLTDLWNEAKAPGDYRKNPHLAAIIDRATTVIMKADAEARSPKSTATQ